MPPPGWKLVRVGQPQLFRIGPLDPAAQRVLEELQVLEHGSRKLRNAARVLVCREVVEAPEPVIDLP